MITSIPTSRFIKTALTGAMVLGLSQAASALEVAPYFHAWGNDSLVEAKKNAGLDSATLAFGITNGSCALDQDLLNKLPDARNYAAAGGRLIISFGGQNGIYAEIACKDDNQLFALLEKVMLDSGTRRLDWDIEGHQLLDTEGTARRTRVLVRLQAKYPDLYTSFTLPGWLRGVSADSMNLLKTTVAAGVRINMVNIMTMSFGQENLRTMVVPSTVAQASIMTFRATATQLATIYPDKTQAQLHAMMGMTPMIGTNDDGSTFSLAEAQTIADFVKVNGVGFLSYWSFQRDRAQNTRNIMPLNMNSGVVQSNYQFFNIFKSAGGYVAPTPAPTPAPTTPAPTPAPTTSTPAPAPAPSSACNSPNWVQGKYYSAGSVVSYTDGQKYTAKFANPGYNPTISTYYWSAGASCSGSSAVAPAPAPAPAAAAAAAPTAAASCSSSKWVQGKYYAAGSVVTYTNNYKYIAKVANPGYNPTFSTYYWTWYAC